jgi:hypothetical protein
MNKLIVLLVLAAQVLRADNFDVRVSQLYKTIDPVLSELWLTVQQDNSVEIPFADFEEMGNIAKRCAAAEARTLGNTPAKYRALATDTGFAQYSIGLMKGMVGVMLAGRVREEGLKLAMKIREDQSKEDMRVGLLETDAEKAEALRIAKVEKDEAALEAYKKGRLEYQQEHRSDPLIYRVQGVMLVLCICLGVSLVIIGALRATRARANAVPITEPPQGTTPIIVL